MPEILIRVVPHTCVALDTTHRGIKYAHFIFIRISNPFFINEWYESNIEQSSYIL